MAATDDAGPIDESADLRVQSELTVRKVVQSCARNLSEAARRLGIGRNTLYRTLREMEPR